MIAMLRFMWGLKMHFNHFKPLITYRWKCGNIWKTTKKILVIHVELETINTTFSFFVRPAIMIVSVVIGYLPNEYCYSESILLYCCIV